VNSIELQHYGSIYGGVVPRAKR